MVAVIIYGHPNDDNVMNGTEKVLYMSRQVVVDVVGIEEENGSAFVENDITEVV